MFLCIESSKFGGNFVPTGARLRVGDGFSHVGSVRMLDEREISAYAAWCGIHGGSALLDAFELACINAGVVRVQPVDADGYPMFDSVLDTCEAVEIIHADDGLQIVWECSGTTCMNQGYFSGRSIVTDGDGNLYPTPACSKFEGLSE